MTTSEATHEGTHLVILHHGLWGNVNHVKFIAEQFKKRLGDRILVYRAQANESSFTYDGVDICGQRLVKEIHSVIKVIEEGGDVEEMKGQKSKKKKNKKTNAPTTTTTTTTPATSTTAIISGKTPSVSPSPATTATNSSRNSMEGNDSLGVGHDPTQLGHSPLSQDPLAAADTATTTQKSIKVTQFSYLGYSLGGLIGRFAIGMLDMERFFDPVEQGGRGIEPVYFVTMATPHLGIRKPSKSNWSKVFNFISARMLSRTGEQLQLVDNYIGGKPILLVLSEPQGIFVKALAKFKRRAVYCNIRNDRTVPFWTASFSDADPFRELDSMQIQYSAGYSSLIESFEPHEVEEIARREREKAEKLKAASLSTRTLIRLKAIPWKKYLLFSLLGPILIPIWIVFASSTISIQGYNSRRRTKTIVQSNKDLDRIRDAIIAANMATTGTATGSSSSIGRPTDTPGSSTTLTQNGATASTAAAPLAGLVMESSVTTAKEPSVETAEAIESYSYPNLKQVKPLALLPVQVEISRNLNQLEWKKNIIHIEGMNAHASIVVREKRFSNDGGIAAVAHAVDMFKDDGEDE